VSEFKTVNVITAVATPVISLLPLLFAWMLYKKRNGDGCCPQAILVFI
jgi:hypothetical protein